MPEQPPQQIFDGSFFKVILATPQLETTPPNVEIESENEILDLEALTEIETFDWEIYNREFFERIPEGAKRTDEGRRMAEIAGTQIWMAKRLPADVVSYLLQVTSTKLLWSYLNADDRKELLQVVTRGFQRTPKIVRQPAVRNRWLHWLEQNQAEIYVLLVMWSFGIPEPPVIAFIKSEANDAHLKRKLPAMFRKFGIEATLCGLSIAARPRLFRTVAELFSNKDDLERLMQNEDTEEVFDEPTTEEPSVADESEDSSAWQAKFEEAHSARCRTSEALEHMRDEKERLTRSLAKLKEELDLMHRREITATAQWEKKLEGIQTRLRLELEEHRKNADRSNRKLRALEKDKLDLDIENKRVKKQLRHTGLLLEEERRKAAPPPPKPEKVLPQPKPQVAPSGPPTPLDEVFQWKADGRPVKITPRALRRLIDRNEEDAVFTVMQALDSLKISDLSLHGKFMKLLGEGASYYVRVLTKSTTRVLVDASNVARNTPNRHGKGQLRLLLGMREELRRLGCFPILFYADASLRHFIDDPKAFGEMVNRGEIVLVDKGVEADEILAREARRTGAYVVTNDAKFFHKVSPDFEPPRVSFRIMDGTVIVDEI